MPISRLISLTAFLVTALATSIVAVAVTFVGGADLPVRVTLIVGLTIVASLGVAFVQWLLVRRLAEAEHRRGLQAVESIETESAGDVPDRQEADSRLHDVDIHHQCLVALVESMGDGVLIIDASNEVMLANTSAGRILRLDPAAVTRQPLDNILDDLTLFHLINDARRRGCNHCQRHDHPIRFEGRPHPHEIATTCVANRFGQVVAVVALIRELAHEKEMAELKSDFVCSVSHELRTPLSSIKAYVEMLVDGEVENESTRTEFYSIIQSETNRLSRLIDNMLNISRIESRMVKPQHDRLQLETLIQEVFDVMNPQARAKHLRMYITPMPDDAIVFADQDMLHQALINLIGNAIKYTPSGGEIGVETTVDPNCRLVHLRIIDTGIGIPAESLPFIFDKFYRVPQHRRVAKGTGLGLNLVKHVVETVHHGQFHVQSEVGQGSTFTITLPMADHGMQHDLAASTGGTPSKELTHESVE